MKRIPIFYTGRLYPSLYALAKAHDLYPQTVTHRLQQGLSLHDALTFPQGKRIVASRDHRPLVPRRDPSKPGRPGTAVTVDGVEYASVKEAAHAHGVHPATVATRLRKGEPLVLALRPAKRVRAR